MRDAYTHTKLVTPSDADNLEISAGNKLIASGIMIGGTGTLKVKTSDDDEVTLTGLAVGVIHPIRVKKVFSTGTTATNIAVFW